METRTYWLSFCDSARPQGQQFLGVVMVDVTADDAAAMRDELAVRFPHAKDGAEWVGAASRKAWALGINPGGEMLSLDITAAESPVPLVKDRLLSFVELEALGLRPVQPDL